MQKNNELTKTLQWDGSVTIIVNLVKILIGLDFPYKQKHIIKKDKTQLIDQFFF